jgi:hypothetical protein
MMTQPSQPELSPIGASFAEHLSAFHRSLPPEEQKLLEEILALADRGMAANDTGGYALNAYLKIKSLDVKGGIGDPSPPGQPELVYFSFGSLLR